MALVTSDGASATVIAAGDDIVTVGWSGAGGSSMLTVDFAEDGTAAIRQWITAHPRGLLRLTFEGSTLGTVAVSPELRRGAVTVGGSAVSTRKRKIESATKHSGFGPHGSA